MTRLVKSWAPRRKGKRGDWKKKGLAGFLPALSWHGAARLAARALGRAFAAIGFCVVLLILMLALFFPKGDLGPPAPAVPPGPKILALDLDGDYPEVPAAPTLTNPLAFLEISFFDLIRTIYDAAADPDVKALYVRLYPNGLSLARIQEFRAAVLDFRKTGKPAHIYTPSFADLGSSLGAYYLASAFDRILMQPGGLLMLEPLSIEEPFFRRALDKIGVKPEYERREAYKSFIEPFMRTDMSPENREMTTRLLKDLSAQITSDIAAARGLTPQEVQKALDKGLLLDDEALGSGLIDWLAYVEEAESDLAAQFSAPFAEFQDYRLSAKAGSHRSAPKSRKSGSPVALVHVNGPIFPAASGAGESFGGENGSADDVADALYTAGDSLQIDTILLRIDSPGGSPSASETIRHAVRYAQDHGKTVIVSMGDMAASGGYWAASAADEIYTLPGTLTGSIGVAGGKFSLAQMWDKLGVNWESVSATDDEESGRFLSLNRPFGDKGRARLNAMLDRTYADFLDRVAEGRFLPPEDLEPLAGGRVWTGRDALNNGLADHEGGYVAVLSAIAEERGLDDWRDVPLVKLPGPDTPLEELMRFLHVSSGTLGDLGTALGALRPALRATAGPVNVYSPARVE